jgi:hypothetical protein
MFSNAGKKCFQLWCVLCAMQFVTFLILHILLNQIAAFVFSNFSLVFL